MSASSSFAVIFDLDGVIVSTDKFHRQGWQRLADELGIPFTEDQARRTRGVDRMASLRVVLGPDHGYSESQMEALASRKNAYYTESVGAITPADLLPGALDRMDELDAHGIAMAIGSASKNAVMVLDRLGISSRFATVVTGSDFTNGKPAPDVFLLAARRLGMPPARCLVFEDAEAGIRAAHAGGMKAVGIGTPVTVAGAERIVPSLAGIRYDEIAALMEE
jgi:kojibiose phosphorylase